MLEYNRTNISEGIDVNKTSFSKECDICHYCYFKNIGFKYEPNLCNGCKKAKSFNNVAIVYVKGIAYRINFGYMSKDDAINITVLIWLIKRVFYEFFFLLYIKMSVISTNYQRNPGMILNRTKDYYKHDKEKIKRASKR